MVNKLTNPRIAFLYPSVELGAYWQPVLREMTNLMKQINFYTGRLWPGFDPNAPGVSIIKVVGNTKFVELSKKAGIGYGRGFYSVSWNIIGYLLKSKPHVIFTSAFSVWTIFSVLLKPLMRWRIVIMWDGSSPNVDFRDSKLRLWLRRAISKFVEAFVTNNHGGKNYLVEYIGVEEKSIFVRPYMVPDAKVLLENVNKSHINIPHLQSPVFLYVGRLEERKGIHYLLKACAILQEQGYRDYTLMIVGDGVQRQEFEALSRTYNLENCIKWVGWVNYGDLGHYFNAADVFVFPTLEDVWGMVVLEAMAFNKPILCSKWAGAYEMVLEGENGYVFDPYEPNTIAQAMKRLIDEPNLIYSMGQKSQQLISQHTPEAAANFFAEIATLVVED
jgi:glycosyltransferase involved in cell wall biosynthesis